MDDPVNRFGDHHLDAAICEDCGVLEIVFGSGNLLSRA